MSRALSDLATFVTNAFIAASKPFVPENIRLGEYTFLPWVRTGLAAGVKNASPGTVRAQATVSFDVEDDAGGSQNVAKTLTVRGPGDVLGFDAAQIVRRYPRPGTTNAEDTFFVHVEFDRPDFPWLFTPFAPDANNRLAPWLALVVLDQSRAFIAPGRPGFPNVVRTRRGELQSLDQSWAWAHAQVIGGPAAPGPSVADRLTDAFGPVNLSRLVCPRRLAPDRPYVACVVPAFDVGARAALGQPGGTLAPAWTRAAQDDDQEITLPVFDFWTFATADDGDFGTLAQKLVGIPAPWNVGRRIVDVSRPGGDITELAPGDEGRIQVVRCALTAPSTARKPDGAPGDDAHWSAAKTEELRTQLNLPDQLSGELGLANPDDLPIVGPRIYARYQRGQSRVTGTPPGDWFDEVNLEPTHRVVAGLGTRVVQKDREQLMQSAWAQVGAIDAANRDIRRAQLARFAGASLHARHLSALGLGDLAQITRGVQSKVRLGGAALTVLGVAARSAAAPAALTGAFRRLTRVRGPLSRYLGGGQALRLRRMVAEGATIRDFRRAYVEPDGIATLSSKAIDGMSPATVARVLGVAPGVALAELAARANRLAAIPSAADQLLAPASTWKPTRSTFDLGAMASVRVTAALHAAMPASIAAHPARAEALGTLFAGVGNSHAPGAASARESVRNISKRLPALRFDVAGRSIPTDAEVAAGVPARAPVGALGAAMLAASLVRFETTASRQLGLTIASARAVRSDVLVAALSEFARGMGVVDLPATPERPPLALARSALLAAIHPRATVTAHITARLASRPSWLPIDWFDDGLVRPIMAAPAFTRPMYEALDAYDRDWLVPGLKKVKEPNFVTLLETNPAFTEAFLAGLSDEMGRELLWRGYPTDQRGTYFRRFWTAEQDELAQDLHRFTQTSLGTHLRASAGGGTGRLVLVVRGELVKRYPDAITLAMRAHEPVAGHPVFIDPASDPTALARILFHAHLAPDILLVGFDLTEADLVPGRWWFVIAEHPTAPRFGFRDGAAALPAHAGLVAHNLLRDPVRAAFEAAKLVAPIKGGA